MADLFPPIEPFDTGLLNVGDGHSIYWEVSGRPDGITAVALHGGPGSGSRPTVRRFFNPEIYRIVVFDQRGCGRSLPHASTPSCDLSSNTTRHLLRDLESLRNYLGIDKWLVFGGSWGSTLGIYYAETNPERVAGIVLWGVAMTSPAEIIWLYRDVAPLFPAQWKSFYGHVPEARDVDGILDAYHKRLHSPDAAIRYAAARAFHDWEWALFTITDNKPQSEDWKDPDFQLARARIITHYFLHHAWLEENQLLENAHRLTGIPGILIHGRMDVGSPLKAAWDLASVWPDGELTIVGGAGHSIGDPGMSERIVESLDRMISLMKL